MITVGSTFTGVGGFDLAARRVGMRVLWQSEIDKQAQSVLMRHFPECVQLGDVKRVNRNTATSPDIIVGGTPCQNLSRSGNRHGLAGSKSILFFEFIRVIEELRPAIAVWENVADALSSNAGRDFYAVLNSFRECGARDIAWRVLNSQHFGVPQRRRRVFIVADFRGERAGEILFEPASAGGYQPPRTETRTEVAATLTQRNRDNEMQYIAPSLTVRNTNDAAKAPIPTLAYALTAKNQRLTGNHQETFIPSRIQTESPRIAGTLAASGAGLDRASGQYNEFDFVVPNDADVGVRRLTPVEAERLQGFPDRWTQWGHDGREMSDTARYRMMGNAVTVNVVEWIMGRIARMF